MPNFKTYAAAGAFRKALEERLKRISIAEQIDLNRLRRQVSFDRLLARLFREQPAPWTLKGGYALELRFKSARSTVDIDLTMQSVEPLQPGAHVNQVVREMVQTAADTPLGDWFEYIIGAPILDLTAAPYGGARYPVETRMDRRVFARFHLDVGIGDVAIPPFDEIVCQNWLAFAGVEAPRIEAISREQQFAEKIHAYTLPRISQNSRVKDLTDLAILIESGGLDPGRIVEALIRTFERRGTHDVPENLAAPPPEWRIPFEALAKECGLQSDLASTFARIQEFLRTAQGLCRRK